MNRALERLSPSPARYLVIAPQGLGDSLEATPLAAALRAYDARAVIDVLVLRRAARDLFAALPAIVTSVTYLPYWERGAPAFVRSVVAERRRERYDATFLCYPAARREYHLLARAFPSRRRYAHRYTKPDFASMLWMHTDLVDVSAEHNVLRNMDLLTAAGIPWRAPQEYVAPAEWFGDGPRARDLVLLHVGSIAHDGLEFKRWPLQHFAKIASQLSDRGYDVRAIRGPDEMAETGELLQAERRVRIVEGSLSHVARTISQAALVIANDNGIAHVAASVGTPVIALFGPTPLTGAPFGASSMPLRPSDCPPCFDVRLLNTTCARNIGFRCIRQDLTTQLVLERALSILTEARGDEKTIKPQAG